jgi:hypothetical protein
MGPGNLSSLRGRYRLQLSLHRREGLFDPPPMRGLSPGSSCLRLPACIVVYVKPKPFDLRSVQECEERFWSKVAQDPDGCWTWTGTRSRQGYGFFKLRGRMLKAHRCSYALTYGEIPDDLFVCHRCDNPTCVRPDHLFLGTARDNTMDRDQKGRTARGDRNGARLHPESFRRGKGYFTDRGLHPQQGEANGRAMLTEEDVGEIRALLAQGTLSQATVAAKYSVSPSTIREIAAGRLWKHLLESGRSDGELQASEALTPRDPVRAPVNDGLAAPRKDPRQEAAPGGYARPDRSAIPSVPAGDASSVVYPGEPADRTPRPRRGGPHRRTSPQDHRAQELGDLAGIGPRDPSGSSPATAREVQVNPRRQDAATGGT